MPVLTVNLPPGVVTNIMRLVREGVFESPEQFLELAARNQLVYEMRAPRNENPPRSTDSVANGAEELDLTVPLYRVPKSPQREWAFAFRIETKVTCPTPASPHLPALGQRIWGQVNRVLPMKLATRFVLARSVDKSQWPLLTQLLEPLSTAAATLGTHLEHLDENSLRKRDELLATGLPRVDNEASRERLVTQFVARTTRDGAIYPGAICQYGLAVINEGRLALTELGVEFSKLLNPVLDGDAPSSTLSDEERAFFVKHIIAHMPTEISDFRAALALIESGHVSPEALGGLLANELRKQDSVSSWTEVMMRTHISGVVSRMVDLGLLRRRWEGRRVNYEIGLMGARQPETGLAGTR